MIFKYTNIEIHEPWDTRNFRYTKIEIHETRDTRKLRYTKIEIHKNRDTQILTYTKIQIPIFQNIHFAKPWSSVKLIHENVLSKSIDILHFTFLENVNSPFLPTHIILHWPFVWVSQICSSSPPCPNRKISRLRHHQLTHPVLHNHSSTLPPLREISPRWHLNKIPPVRRGDF